MLSGDAVALGAAVAAQVSGVDIVAGGGGEESAATGSDGFGIVRQTGTEAVLGRLWSEGCTTDYAHRNVRCADGQRHPRDEVAKQ